MINVTAYNNFRFDFQNPTAMGIGMLREPSSFSATEVTVYDEFGGRFVLKGFGFAYNPATDTASGTVTTVEYYNPQGVLNARVEGSLDAGQAMQIGQTNGGGHNLLALVTSGNDSWSLGDRNDIVDGGLGSDSFDGNGGIDLVRYMEASSTSFDLQLASSGSAQVRNTLDGSLDTLTDIERVQFSDGTLAIDIDGIAGQAYRLYQAAFDRTPDTAGLSFWVDQMDHGTSLHASALNFVGSAEFAAAYGANLSDEIFVSQLYRNVLGRDPDAAGISYWVDELGKASMDRGNVLIGFSESGENVALVGDAIADGIWLG